MFLTQLNEEENRVLKPHLEEVLLGVGEKLYTPGERAQGIFFLQSGRLGVQTSTGFEDKQQVIALLDPGAIVGENGLAGPALRVMTVYALQDSVLVFLSTEAFSALERREPRLAFTILKKALSTASMRLQANSERLAHVL
ncbi:MAG: Crp/Fnr family transcriptional regulator [Desulfopila sp.]